MRLKVWINAFIPRNVAGYTVAISRGTHAGKTAVPLPGLARTNPWNLFKNLHAGYLTDQRTFDSSPAASVRMQSLAIVEVPGLSLVSVAHRSSGTTEVDTDTGAELDFGVADMSRCRFLPLVRTGMPTGTAHWMPPSSPASPMVGSLVLPLVGAAGDPLVSTAADIDYSGEFQVVLKSAAGALEVRFSGLIDAFPAFEAYAALNGVTKALFTAPPPAGNTVVSLLGPASRPVQGVVSFP